MWELLTAYLVSLGFLALAAFSLWLDWPAVVFWLSLALGVAGLAALVLRLRRRSRGYDESTTAFSADEPVALRDGRDYRVDVTDAEIVLTQKSTGEVRRVPWNELTQVFVVAIDRFPVGSMSFVVHRGSNIVEIPSDSEGNGAFLAAMQEKLPGFDNEAMIEASAMLHGFKQLWNRP